MVKQYGVPSEPRIPGFRAMEKKDVPQVGELLQKYLAKFDVTQVFDNDDEVEHWFLSGKGGVVDGKEVEQVVYAYVVEVSSCLGRSLVLSLRVGPYDTCHHRYGLLLRLAVVDHETREIRCPQCGLSVLLRIGRYIPTGRKRRGRFEA